VPKPVPFEVPRWGYYLILAGGIAYTAMYLNEERQLRRIPTEYREAPCTVTHARMIVHSRRWSEGSGYRSGYTPVITYRYTVDGTTYTSDTYRRPERPMGDWRKVNNLMVTHAAGTKHTCWYDPDDPSEAVLSREVDPHALDLAGASAVVFLALGVGLVVWRELFARRAAPPEPAEEPAPPSPAY
jgi:hypothetical protein